MKLSASARLPECLIITPLLVKAGLSWRLVEILMKISLLSAWLGIARALCHLWTVVTCRAYRLQLSVFQALAAAWRSCCRPVGNATRQIKLCSVKSFLRKQQISFLLHTALQMCMIISLS